MFNRRNIFAARSLIIAASLALGATAVPAFAGGGHESRHGHGHVDDLGQPGKSSEVTRTIEIVMADNYFEPERLEIEPGETIRFAVRNEGSIVHEFNIGTAEMHHKHQSEMVMMMQHGVIEMDKIHHDRMNMDMGNGHTMKHDDPNSVLLEPNTSAAVIWKFQAEGALEFACNMPGHYESGMVGEITLKR